MADPKLSKTIRSASAVNLRYSADLLNLGREYIKAFSSALTQSDDDPEPGTPKKPAPSPPLLLAGHAGETANAAFMLNGSSKTAGTISLQVSGDFADSKVSIDPQSVALDSKGEKVIRIIARIGRKMPADVDHIGTVTIPEMDHQITQFVLRKLPK